VELAKENFAADQALSGLSSSQTTATDPNGDKDLNDDGIDDPDPSVNGIRSGVVAVTPNSEPTDEPGLLAAWLTITAI